MNIAATPARRSDTSRSAAEPEGALHPGAMARLAQAGWLVATRAAFASFLITTSAYCLLLYIPFTYFGFIHNPLLSWLPVFVRIHPKLYAVLLAAVITTLRPDLRESSTRKSALAFVLLNAGIAVYLLVRPALAVMERDLFAYVWSMLCVFPLIWLGSLDLTRGRQVTTGDHGLQSSLMSAAGAGVTAAVVFWLTSRTPSADAADSPALDVAATVAVHVAIFSSLAMAVWALEKGSSLMPNAQSAWTMARGALAWVLGAGLIRYVILPTLSFDGMQANIFSAVVSLALVITWVGVEARLRTRAPAESPFQLAKWALLPVTAVVLVGAYAIPKLLGPTDWDFVLQKVSVIALWAALWIAWRRVALGKARAAGAVALGIVLAATAAMAAYRVLAKLAPTGARYSLWNAQLEAYTGSDIGFKTAYDLLSRSVDNDAHQEFYDFLRANTNLGPNTAATPADIQLVTNLVPTPGKKPNIFLFVIDSLRQDYLSSYNPDVTFTPQIRGFAADSIVMKNAFSRYAGTALSEPAIWAGAMQLHKQYLEPFAPMNSLQKLVETEGYHSYISVDPIVRMMLAPSQNITSLDTDNKNWNDLDFCPTLKELETKLKDRTDPDKPIFAYTQPQNVHTVTLERQAHGRSRREISIAELNRMDAAFGEFVDFLKQRGLYDNSIIILTSDHGDSYGEFGRYGHADFLFPEIMRIPLIVHLPAELRRQVVWDDREVSFSLDITPSLYYLLGHKPVEKNPLFGRPLFTANADEATGYIRPQYLLVSSYAAVYGLLSKRGQSLFIVDAVNHRNYFYDLAKDPLGVHNRVTPQLRDASEPVIRQEIRLIDNFYHFDPSNSR